ncbi:transposase [Stappia sp. P2PMeth1]|uniref:transposase n=1 Tax=Stappia sp. P2PMeth1 TaxID=2003586 RepID=UPI001FCB26BB|nr:transposase [Stappia sp. P2PMeth1]
MRDDRSFHVLEAVPDRLEGAPRCVRREWSEAFKVRLVAETLVPGTNVSAIARREGSTPPVKAALRAEGERRKS